MQLSRVMGLRQARLLALGGAFVLGGLTSAAAGPLSVWAAGTPTSVPAVDIPAPGSGGTYPPAVTPVPSQVPAVDIPVPNAPPAPALPGAPAAPAGGGVPGKLPDTQPSLPATVVCQDTGAGAVQPAPTPTATPTPAPMSTGSTSSAGSGGGGGGAPDPAPHGHSMQ